MQDVEKSIIFGSFEYVSIPEFDVYNTVAKVDTGAYSGALHCSFIKEHVGGGGRTLEFIPSDNKESIKTKKYKRTVVRSSTGHEEKRYLVDTEIVIKDKKYTITIGLTNREKMQREVLIGRRFLRENNILVDTRIHQELDNDGGEK